MTFLVIVTDEARRNVNSIRQWIAERSPQGASSWTEAYRSALNKLSVDPLRPALAPESREFDIDLRQLFFRTRRGRTYRILYHVVLDTVVVLHVRGPGQRPIK
jgi:plasmid stabilization system protein ParE